MKMIIKSLLPNLLLVLCLSLSISGFAQPDLPLIQINDLEYEGAFAITAEGFNASYGRGCGIITYNSTNNSLFVAGILAAGTIGEFSIPPLVNSTDLAALNTSTVLQHPTSVLNLASNGNPENINVINGMEVVNGKLIVNGEEWYDPTNGNASTTLTINNPSNIANSTINGYYSLEGAAHASGWISPIPGEWQSALGGAYITGNSDKYSGVIRYPMGMTAFVFNPSNLNGPPSGIVPTTTLLDFTRENPLYADFSDYTDAYFNLEEAIGTGFDVSTYEFTAAQKGVVPGSNNLWTALSKVNYGFIIPGTSTYIGIGSSGGHNEGIGYKATIDGIFYDGITPYDLQDYVNYYWLWDVDDLLDVKNGVKNPYDVRPYDYGIFDAPFQESNPQTVGYRFHGIVGGAYNTDNGLLYLAIDYGGSVGAYDRIPAIAAYKINIDNNNCPTAGTPCNDGNPNTTNDVEDGFCNCSGTPPPSGECELLTNTDFDNDLTGNWGHWGCTPQAINGIANITNIASGNNTWEAGFVQSGLTIEQGENYNIKFRARAANNRPVQVLVQHKGAPYTQYYATTVNLTTSMQNYNLSFTMNEPTDNNTNFIFQLGGNSTNTFIDNASLTKDDCGPSCPQQGQNCNDNNPCTTGETYDANCNCTGGVYTDTDGDGLCIGEDPNDNDPCNPNPCNGCDVFDDQDFESGWGIWNDGGSDVRRSINDANYANNGSYCARLRDNSGALSSMYTDALDMSALTSVDVSFSYITNSMENNEDFFLEFSTNNGTSYAVIGRWVRERDFDNGTRYNETVSIDGPLSSNTRLRFRCDASDNGDLVYIDDVRIEACGGTISTAKVEVLSASVSVNLYPNPANQSIQIDCEMSENTQAQIQVYDNIGQLVKNMTNIELHEGTQTLNVDVSDLPAGMYFCALQSNEWQTVKKFVIAR